MSYSGHNDGPPGWSRQQMPPSRDPRIQDQPYPAQHGGGYASSGGNGYAQDDSSRRYSSPQDHWRGGGPGASQPGSASISSGAPYMRPETTGDRFAQLPSVPSTPAPSRMDYRGPPPEAHDRVSRMHHPGLLPVRERPEYEDAPSPPSNNSHLYDVTSPGAPRSGPAPTMMSPPPQQFQPLQTGSSGLINHPAMTGSTPTTVSQSVSASIAPDNVTVTTPGPALTADSELINIAEQLAGLQLSSFYVRPGFGRAGRPITVESNYFMVRALDGRGEIINHYDVDINPVVRVAKQKKPRTLLRAVWEQLVLEQEHHEAWAPGLTTSAFDGRRNVFTPNPLPIPEGESITLNVSLAATNEVQQPSRKDETSDDEYRRWRVTIKRVAKVDLEAVMKFCRADSGEARDPKAEEACLTGVMATNVLLRDVPSKTYTQVGATGNKFYTLEGARPLPQGAVVLNGFMQSFRYSNSGYPLLNIDLGFSAFLMSGPALDVVAKILGSGPGGMRGGPRGAPHEFRGPLSELNEQQIAILKKKLRGARFKVLHRQSSRLHTVITVTARSSQDLSFVIEGKDGGPERTVSVAEYYREYYSATVRYPRLPCIQYGKRAYIPLEFVHLDTFNSLPPTNLTADQTAEMIKTSAMRPPDRKNKVMEWRRELAYEKQPKIAAWGLQVNNSMVKVKARVLPPPSIRYDGQTMQPRFGAWNLRNVRFVRKGLRPLNNWAVVSFDRFCDTDDMARWVEYLVRRLEVLGVSVQNKRPELIRPSDPRGQGNLLGNIKLAARAAYMVSKELPQLICIILPGKDAWLYEEIKRISFTELHLPVATQCMQGSKIVKNDRGLLAYTDNLCMKIAQKLGGLSHQVAPRDMPGLVPGKTMILGADLGHPPFRPGSESSAPTVACSIATYNAECDAYSAQIRLQEGRSEIIADLSDMVEMHLRVFAKENDGEYPERILVFRDGISEGQYAAALQYEHDAIVRACNRIQSGYRPRILVCVCAKRHNTRFFATSHGDGDRSGNLPAGLVVDSTVTHPFAFDFFLQAHAGLVGTARPTHYICLLDELAITPDDLQQLTNALCYSFARCTRSVSLVPVCYMADLVCQKARLIVQQSESTISPSETSGGRSRSRVPPPPSMSGTDGPGTSFRERVDINHIQRLLSKNPELERVAWWM